MGTNASKYTAPFGIAQMGGPRQQQQQQQHRRQVQTRTVYETVCAPPPPPSPLRSEARQRVGERPVPCQYRDANTGTVHDYAAGDNVILLNRALKNARECGLVEVATVAGVGRDGVRLRLYSEAVPEREGWVGTPHAQQVAIPPDVLYGQESVIRPLPIYVRHVPTGEIRQRLTGLVRWIDVLAGAMTELDPDASLKAACGCACAQGPDIMGAPVAALACDPVDERRVEREANKMLVEITAHAPEGAVRHTTLVCDAAPSDSPLSAVSDATRCARPVIISTVGLAGNTMRYGVVPPSAERTVQSAALCAYGLPLTPAYYGAVEWGLWSEYEALVRDAAAHLERAFGSSVGAEVPVDSLWLRHLVKDLARRGYRVSAVDLGCPIEPQQSLSTSGTLTSPLSSP